MARVMQANSNEIEWNPTQWPSIFKKLLQNDSDTGARAILLKFDPGAHLPRHRYPGGEEVYMLEGRARFEDTWYEAGHYLYSPPGSEDDVYTDTGATMFVSLPKSFLALKE